MGTVQEYFDTLEPETRAAYERVRELVVALVPDVTEGTSYGIAALMYRDKPLIGFRAAKTHLSVFPYSGRAVTAALDHLEGFDASKGTVRFDVDRPLPDEAIRDLVEQRVAEIEGLA